MIARRNLLGIVFSLPLLKFLKPKLSSASNINPDIVHKLNNVESVEIITNWKIPPNICSCSPDMYTHNDGCPNFEWNFYHSPVEKIIIIKTKTSNNQLFYIQGKLENITWTERTI